MILKKVSVIIPLYTEQDTLIELFQRIKKILTNIVNNNFEVIFIDDGSTDNSKK